MKKVYTLFVALILLVFFPETLNIDKTRKIEFDVLQKIEKLKVLTPRELEVCFYLLNGFSNGKISSILFISENTVKTHTSRIYNKLYVSSRGELKEYMDNIIGYKL